MEERDLAGWGAGAKKWDERERRKDTVRRFSNARDRCIEVRDGSTKGLRFYHQLTDLSVIITLSVRSFITDRQSERDRLVRGGAGARHH